MHYGGELTERKGRKVERRLAEPWFSVGFDFRREFKLRAGEKGPLHGFPYAPPI